MESISFIGDQWEFILAIIYMIYNEFKHKQHNTSLLIDDKLELSKQVSTELQKDIDKKYYHAIDEIERFIINKFKHYKLRILKHFDGQNQLVIIAVDGILLTIMLKIQRELLIHVKENGYHDLNHTELDSYISYISDSIFDIFDMKLNKTEDMIEIKKYINIDDIQKTIRDIFETSINISNRALISEKIVDNL